MKNLLVNLRLAFHRAASALIVATLIAGCGGKSPTLPPLDSKAVVLAFGDSLTFGTGANPEQSYPARVAKLIGREVVNRGVPGEVSSDGLARLTSAIDETQPALLLLCHGGNVFLRKLDAKQTEANLRSMVKLARDRNVAVVLIATPKPGLFLSAPDFYETIAKDYQLPLEQKILASVLSDNALKSDLIHPNADGYAKIADAVARLLTKAGAI